MTGQEILLVAVGAAVVVWFLLRRIYLSFRFREQAAISNFLGASLLAVYAVAITAFFVGLAVVVWLYASWPLAAGVTGFGVVVLGSAAWEFL